MSITKIAPRLVLSVVFCPQFVIMPKRKLRPVSRAVWESVVNTVKAALGLVCQLCGAATPAKELQWGLTYCKFT